MPMILSRRIGIALASHAVTSCGICATPVTTLTSTSLGSLTNRLTGQGSSLIVFRTPIRVGIGRYAATNVSAFLSLTTHVTGSNSTGAGEPMGLLARSSILQNKRTLED